VEVRFGILSRKALRGASIHDIEQLRSAIEEIVAAYGQEARPFVWRKREVKGSQLRNTIVNLRKEALAFETVESFTDVDLNGCHFIVGQLLKFAFASLAA